MMHEYAIVSALFARIEDEAKKNHASRVHRVTVKLGAQAGVDPDLFVRAFETFSTRTICEGAELAVEQVPARWVCARCGAAIPTRGLRRCTACNVPARLAAGEEILLERIEMEVDDV